MRIGEFLSDRLYQILLHAVCMAALAVFLLATGTAPGIVLLVMFIWALGLAVVLGVGYSRANARLQELEAVMAGLDKKYLFAECAPRARSHYERRVFGLLRRGGKAMIEAVSQAQADQADYREHIENWVHEVKAPITAARLICQNDGPAAGRRLLPPLAEIDGHVERALYYARAGGVERDFVIREVSLAEVVDEAVGRHKTLLIQSGMQVETEGLELPVYTDAKWVAFILGQLLANAARYRGEAPLIRITAKQLGRLVRLNVRDNGIGIPAHELSRVFDKGFTGSNGRQQGGATGMGLYIAQKLAGHLQIEMEAASDGEGTGADISLVFPARENLSEL